MRDLEWMSKSQCNNDNSTIEGMHDAHAELWPVTTEPSSVEIFEYIFKQFCLLFNNFFNSKQTIL